jgi:hypothetical protein
MGTTRIFLLQLDGDDAAILAGLRQSLRAAGHSVTDLVVASDALSGSDEGPLRTLSEIRSACSPDQPLPAGTAAGVGPSGEGAEPEHPVLVALGLGACLALWIDALDLPKPRRIRLATHSVELEQQFVSAPVLAGVVALGPFLGFDFSLERPRLGALGAKGVRLRLCRHRFWAGVMGGLYVHESGGHGLHADKTPTWADLARVLPFASVAEILPSLKRPTAVVLDAGAKAADVEVLLRSLSGRVAVLDSPMQSPDLSQVTLAAVDWILKGAPPPDD